MKEAASTIAASPVSWSSIEPHLPEGGAWVILSGAKTPDTPSGVISVTKIRMC